MLIVEEWINTSQAVRQLHLKLDEPCLERGGDSYQHRGVLAQFLDTSIPKVRTIHLCHACNNETCSNPRHLYWGTAAENRQDAISSGRWQPSKEGHPQDEMTRRAISAALRGMVNNPTGVNGGGVKGRTFKRKYRQVWITDGVNETRIPTSQTPKTAGFGSEWRYGRLIRVTPDTAIVTTENIVEEGEEIYSPVG